MVSCAVGISESMGKVFSCGFVEASEMFLQGAWVTWQILSLSTFAAVEQVSSISSPFMGATWNVCPTYKQR